MRAPVYAARYSTESQPADSIGEFHGVGAIMKREAITSAEGEESELSYCFNGSPSCSFGRSVTH